MISKHFVKTKLLEKEQGFTLIEVLIAILIATIFITVAMQAVVVAAIFKARAKEISEATIWIQQDLENLKQQTAIVGYTTISAAPTTALPSLFSLSSTLGFASGNQLQISTATTTFSATVSGLSGNTITLNSSLTPAQILDTLTGTTVSVLATDSTKTTLCYANANNNGFGNLLSNNLPTLNSSNNTKTIAGKTYTLSRAATVRNVAPYEVLQINYIVAQGSNTPIATLNTEVIPNAAFQCPAY